MEERGGVLVQNEKHANKSVAKVMRITFLIFSMVFLLNVLGIFVVDMKIMAIAYIWGSILLWVPTIIVNITKNFEEIKEYVQHKGETLIGYKQTKEKASVRVEDILYFETLDGRVFAYTVECVYEIKR